MSKYESNSSINNNDSKKMGIANYFFWFLGVSLFLTFISVFIIFKPEHTDINTNCGEHPPRHLVVLLDLSDPLSQAQKASLHTRFEHISNSTKSNYGLSLSKGDNLTIYFMKDMEVPKLVFSACSPGSSNETNVLNKGKKYADSKWNNFSNTILEKIESEISESSNLSSSFIIESIAYVRAKEFPASDHISKNTQELNIVIISDFLQNSPLLSHYEKGYLEAIQLSNKLSLNLNGINIDALFILNHEYNVKQNAELLLWWRKYFSQAVTGANLNSWRAL